MNEWDMESEDSSEGSLGGGSAISDADAAALGMDTAPPEFYDPEADDRDEAWAAKMRRSHRSDAVLSCPLCFTTLCIDCQQHEKFDNQFRAVFVMNCKVRTREVVTIPDQPAKKGKQKRQRRQQQQQLEALQPPVGQQQHQQQPDAAAQRAHQDQQQHPAAEQEAAAPPVLGQQGLSGAAAGAAEQQDQQQQQQRQQATEAQMNPVCCAVCDTEVGLRDVSEGVYHFFNVFASNS